MTNLLTPASADDLAAALLDEAGAEPDAKWREGALSRLAQELRSNADHAVAASDVPSWAPEWARAGGVQHLLPASRIRDEAATVVSALEAAPRRGLRLRRRNNALFHACAQMLGASERERWPELVVRARALIGDFDLWDEAERERRRNALRLCGPLTSPGARGRVWRRVESVAQLLERGRGTAWCVVKGGEVAEGYFEPFRSGDLIFWTLHGADDEVLALLSCGSDGSPDELRDRRNQATGEHRDDMLRLARAGVITLDHQSSDIAGLALDLDLGRRGQPFYYGVLTGRHCEAPIRYRLWSNGRRRRYLLATGSDLKRTPQTYLRLDVSGPPRSRSRSLNGAVELAWGGLSYELMNAALADAFPKTTRPAHVKGAMRSAFKAG